VVKSGQWGGYPYPGPQTSEFIARFVEMQGDGFPVLMANGTVTIEVALRSADVGWGDEVIVPALTFQATAAAPLAAGAVPVIVDIEAETYCLDPRAVEKAITPRTRAIIPVHLGAQMTDMDSLMEIAERHDLIVVEDCAHAHGAKWRGRGAGTFGHFGSFSLQASKILTSGEGGILLCRTEELQKRAESIINCGRPYTNADGNTVFTMGSNFRLGEFQAALGVVGLQRFADQVKQRAEAVNYLEESLSEVPGIRLLKRDPRHTTRSFYMYGFAIDPNIFQTEHKTVVTALAAEGIPCSTGYPPMHHYDLFQPHNSRLAVPNAFPEHFDYSQTSFPVAERAGEQESVWLPECVFRDGQRGIDDFITALNKVQANGAELARNRQNIAG
jgi:dTDP-4-amino-4,6-dideoxygalactose transaminase